MAVTKITHKKKKKNTKFNKLFYSISLFYLKREIGFSASKLLVRVNPRLVRVKLRFDKHILPVYAFKL